MTDQIKIPSSQDVRRDGKNDKNECDLSLNSVVSVIIPIYNVEKYLCRCLDSVVGQTYKDLQIICVIDGSTDSCKEICSKYSAVDGRIEIIIQPNSGCARARNNALKKAKGQYICFIDPDDYVGQNYIESLVRAIQKYDADIALATMIRLRGKSRKYRTHFSGVKKFEALNQIMRAAECPPNYMVINKLYKASFIAENALSFEEGLAWCDDIRFCVESLLMAKSIVCVEEAVYYYVKRSGSIVGQRRSLEMQRQRFMARSRAVEDILARGIDVSRSEAVVTKLQYTFLRIPIMRVRVDFKTHMQHWLLFGFIPIYSRAANG